MIVEPAARDTAHGRVAVRCGLPFAERALGRTRRLLALRAVRTAGPASSARGPVTGRFRPCHPAAVTILAIMLCVPLARATPWQERHLELSATAGLMDGVGVTGAWFVRPNIAVDLALAGIPAAGAMIIPMGGLVGAAGVMLSPHVGVAYMIPLGAREASEPSSWDLRLGIRWRPVLVLGAVAFVGHGGAGTSGVSGLIAHTFPTYVALTWTRWFLDRRGARPGRLNPGVLLRLEAGPDLWRLSSDPAAGDSRLRILPFFGVHAGVLL